MAAAGISARELLERLACGLVDQPEEVSVEEFEEEDGTVLLELAVAEEDYGKVIGRSGGTVRALRAVVAAAGRAAAGEGGGRTLVDVVE